MPASKLVVCYSLGTGAGLDLQLAGLSRQICEDIAEILALCDDFISIPQMLVVRENADIDYAVDKNACAFAVFYSLPETKWIIDATRSINGDIALTGRILDDESGIILSINMIDVATQNLLFCGYETCSRDQIQNALANLCAKLLSRFTKLSAEAWLPSVREMIGTESFHAYANWMGMREIERRAQREGLPAPKSRIVEHLTYALSADPNYHRAALKLCEIMSHQLETHNYDFILRNLLRLVTHNEAISLIVVQSLARLNRRAEAELHLNTIIEKYPKNGLFWLMRGCLRTDEKQAARDLDEAKYLLGNDFHGCRSAVDNAFISVTGV